MKTLFATLVVLVCLLSEASANSIPPLDVSFRVSKGDKVIFSSTYNAVQIGGDFPFNFTELRREPYASRMTQVIGNSFQILRSEKTGEWRLTAKYVELNDPIQQDVVYENGAAPPTTSVEIDEPVRVLPLSFEKSGARNLKIVTTIAASKQ